MRYSYPKVTAFLPIAASLVVLAIAQAIAGEITDRRFRLQGAPRDPRGELASVEVWLPGAADPVPLSRVAAGECRLVIVYESTCPASRTAARRWVQDMRATADTAALPTGWTALWVSLDPIADTNAILPNPFPLLTATAVSRLTVLSSLGVRSSPSHVVLDRDGRIVLVGQGAPLHTVNRYLPDCSIDPALGGHVQ